MLPDSLSISVFISLEVCKFYKCAGDIDLERQRYTKIFKYFFRCGVLLWLWWKNLVSFSPCNYIEEEENLERPVVRRPRIGIITFTEEETAELAKTETRLDATVSEKVLVQSAAEKDRVSEIKDKNIEIEEEPKHANQCSFCTKSFKKPSDLVR